ncbi:ABC transporter permease [Rudaeicoccus suwonensis]|uniref:ABC transporter permease n=1 Tax=Rudaeicoccus suwonensis TaxID=657409 RepID=UPI001FE9474D|nr:ABC transporter permease [Rudaeicoccus suwonensis]
MEQAHQGAAGGLPSLDGPAPQESKSPTRIAMERLRKDKVAVACAVVIVLMILMGIFAPLLAGLEGQSPTTAHYNLVGADSLPTFYTNSQHWLGVTSSTGYDVFARLVYGIRPSLLIAVGASIGSTVIGVLLGLIGGYFGGWPDKVIVWIIDFTLSLPFLLLAIALVPVTENIILGGNSEPTDSQTQTFRIVAMLFVLIFLLWGGTARLIRGEVLSLREREFIQAARALGAPTNRIIFKEVLPNLLSIFLVNFTTAVPAYVSAEAGLSYLGVGISPPTADWGLDINEAQQQMQNFALPLLVPLVALLILVLALSLLGDAVSDAFNPNTRR